VIEAGAQRIQKELTARQIVHTIPPQASDEAEINNIETAHLKFSKFHQQLVCVTTVASRCTCNLKRDSGTFFSVNQLHKVIYQLKARPEMCSS
jgi:hypothetical protein